VAIAATKTIAMNTMRVPTPTCPPLSVLNMVDPLARKVRRYRIV
jgi:hypothetical protein